MALSLFWIYSLSCVSLKVLHYPHKPGFCLWAKHFRVHCVLMWLLVEWDGNRAHWLLLDNWRLINCNCGRGVNCYCLCNNINSYSKNLIVVNGQEAVFHRLCVTSSQVLHCRRLSGFALYAVCLFMVLSTISVMIRFRKISNSNK